MPVSNIDDRKRVRWFTCDICGYTWSSFGKGKRITCPKCYENRTGKKLGGDPEHMAAMRAAKGKNKDQQTNIYDFMSDDEKQGGTVKSKTPGKIEHLPPQKEPETDSLLNRILNKKIL